MKRLLRRKSRLPETITENEDQAMDQNPGLEAKIFREQTRTTLTMGLWEIPAQLITISLRDQTLHTGTAIRMIEDHMINAQINPSIETMVIGLEMDFSTTKLKTGETLEFCFVLHRLKGEISQKQKIYRQPRSVLPSILLSAKTDK